MKATLVFCSLFFLLAGLPFVEGSGFLPDRPSVLPKRSVAFLDSVPPPLLTQSKSQSATATALTVPRGGGILPGPELAFKIFLTVFGLNNIPGLVAPRAQESIYGISPVDNLTDSLMMELSGVGANVALLLYLQGLKGLSFETAVGWSCLPYMAQVLFRVATGKFSDAGLLLSNAVIVLALNGYVVYASLTDAPFAKGLVGLYAVFSLINGLGFLFTPDKIAAQWNIKLTGPTRASNIHLHAAFGSFLISHFMAIGMQTFFGMDYMQAAAWTAASFVVTLTWGILNGNYKAANIPVNLTVVWNVFLAAMAYCMLQ